MILYAYVFLLFYFRMQKAAVETVAELKNASRAGIEYSIMNNKVRIHTTNEKELVGGIYRKVFLIMIIFSLS